MNLSCIFSRTVQIRKYFIAQRDEKGGTYGIFNPVKRSEQPGQEREGICNDCAWGQFQGHECGSD